jgi:two-component sensor histidine kinase
MIRYLLSYIRSMEPTLPPAQEEKYLLAYYHEDMKQLKTMMLFLIGFSFLWMLKEIAVADYRFPLMTLFILRVGYIAAGAVFLLKQKKNGSGLIDRKYFMLFALLLLVHQAVTFASRPLDYPFTSYTSMVLIFLIFFTFPYSLLIRSLFSFSMSLFEILFILVKKEYESGGVFTVIIIYIVMNITCMIYSARANSTRRRNFRQLLEKEILLREVHHRIKNNIASITGYLALGYQTVSNPEAQSALKVAMGRVNIMGLLYDNLLISDDYRDISVKQYADHLIDSIMELYDYGKHISVSRNIDDFNLSSRLLFPLGIIINELFTNSMKYAFTGRDSGTIDFSLSLRDSMITLVVRDNGTGLNKSPDSRASSGFGITLVKMLVEHMEGSLVTETSGGTRWEIRIRA